MTATSPAARFRWVFAYRTLLKYLVLKEIKVKSRGTYLGVAWTLMNPLVTIVTYFVVFQYVFRVAIPNFVAFFLVGLLMWIFFSRAISTSATCVIDNEGMIKRAAFPLEMLPGVRCSIISSTIWWPSRSRSRSCSSSGAPG